MPYIENRLVHDADSHLMEMSDCLNPYFEKSLLTRFLEHPNLGVRVGNRLAIEDAQKRQEDALFRASAGENIMLRKNYEAQGAFLKADRPAAKDHIGVASQLVFTTFCLGNFGFDQSGDIDLCYGAATAHNRMMTDFCSVDKRLLATAYVPLEDFDRAEKTAKAAIEMGAKALMIGANGTLALLAVSHTPVHHALMFQECHDSWRSASFAAIDPPAPAPRPPAGQ